MAATDDARVRARLMDRKKELEARLERIHANVRRGYDPDSKERAKELEDSDVVDALGNEARDEVRRISVALQRLDAGQYGLCVACGSPISRRRLDAYPLAGECIDCARLDEQRRA
ncbi:MAG: TraR/DksA family transcriptional regulator [Woeseiaceae bacterium]|nr:TraR/DksA family transcriptional regulator [Woeseiaceae bacterium]